MPQENIDWTGKKAPAFTGNCDKNGKVSLKSLSEDCGGVVLYFYPKDLTPGCSTQAENFTRDYKKFEKQGIEIIGVSCDPLARHEKFREKFSIPYPLLADEDQKICNKYKVWQQKSMYGKKFWGIVRSTFLINSAGKIVAYWGPGGQKLAVKTHSADVMAAAKELL